MIVRLTGGMCNQMFMYAFGRSLSVRKNEPVEFHFRRSTWDYALEAFHLPIRLASPISVPLMYSEGTFGFDQRVYDVPTGYYYNGYWQSEKYFDVDLIREDFKPWLTTPLRASWPSNQVSIHVRRGDYLNPGTKKVHGAPSQEYYQAAIDHMKARVPDAEFKVFTDDINMKEFMGYPVVSDNNYQAHLDLWMMTGYQNAILANSTFGWWGAWLGEAKNVIAPKQWFADPKIDTSDLIPERWVRL